MKSARERKQAKIVLLLMGNYMMLFAGARIVLEHLVKVPLDVIKQFPMLSFRKKKNMPSYSVLII